MGEIDKARCMDLEGTFSMLDLEKIEQSLLITTLGLNKQIAKLENKVKEYDKTIKRVQDALDNNKIQESVNS